MTEPTPTNPTVEADDLKVQGNTCYRNRQYEEAIEFYTQAIAIRETAVYYSNRALCHMNLENVALALADANRAVELDPTYMKGYYRRGCANLLLRNLRPAVSDFTTIIKANPRDRNARLRYQECRQMLTADQERRRLAFLSAIATEKSLLPSERIKWRNMVVPSTYTGPSLDVENLESYTEEWVLSTVERFRSQERIHLKYVYFILFRMLDLLRPRPNIARITVPPTQHITVCGDTHGQFYDLLHLFDLNGYPSPSNPYVFNGDFVDRGSFSCENVLTLFAFMCLYPCSLTLTRGNHEALQLNQWYGFGKECKTKYGEDVFDLFQEVFNYLQLAAVLNNSVFICHGGVGFQNDGVTLQMIDENVNRVCDIPNSGLMCDLLWSDPQNQMGRAPNKRGVSSQFGPDVLNDFLETNDLKLLIRSHEMKMGGAEVQFGGKLITVFSSPNYCDRANNQGAFIKLDGETMTPDIVRFDAVPHPKTESYMTSFG